MADPRVSFQTFLEEEINRCRGLYAPIKSSLLERLFVRKASCKKLHPNLEDEFCDPKIGPNYEIISNYQEELRTLQAHAQPQKFKERLIVEKAHPDGYILLNGHHRWAAALRSALPSVPIKIVSLTQTSDVYKMLENAKHDQRAALDLDEVVFAPAQDGAAEKALPFPANKVYQQQLRRGVPELFRFLKNHGYDIWVYSAQYYSMDYIQVFFKLYGLQIDNIVTGTSRKGQQSAEEKKQLETMITKKYAVTVHPALRSLTRISSEAKTFEEYELTGNPETWAQEIMEILSKL